MKNRYDKLVFETEKGITSEASEKTGGELIIRDMLFAKEAKLELQMAIFATET